MFTVQPFVAPELGNSSFLVADPDAGEALVIDAFRDVEGYLTHAETKGVRPVRALDTHLHNDFVSGARELTTLAGSRIDPLEVGDEFQVGSFTLRALDTPGHTPTTRATYSSRGADRGRCAPGAVHVYVPDIPHHAAEVPHEAPVAVHCGVGYRAGIAASLLEQAGLKQIIHLHGSYADWALRHLHGLSD